MFDSATVTAYRRILFVKAESPELTVFGSICGTLCNGQTKAMTIRKMDPTNQELVMMSSCSDRSSDQSSNFSRPCHGTRWAVSWCGTSARRFTSMAAVAMIHHQNVELWCRKRQWRHKASTRQLRVYAKSGSNDLHDKSYYS